MTYEQEIKLLRAEGKTYREIQEELGCSKSTICFHLGEKQKEKSRARTASRRTKVYQKYQQYKESLGCADCGQKYPHWLLDFDHREGTVRRGSPGQAASTFNAAAGDEELEKCDVVCPNCHRIRTYNRKPW